MRCLVVVVQLRGIFIISVQLERSFKGFIKEKCFIRFSVFFKLPYHACFISGCDFRFGRAACGRFVFCLNDMYAINTMHFHQSPLFLSFLFASPSPCGELDDDDECCQIWLKFSTHNRFRSPFTIRAIISRIQWQ